LQSSREKSLLGMTEETMKLILASGLALSVMTTVALAEPIGSREAIIDRSAAAPDTRGDASVPMVLSDAQMEKVAAGHYDNRKGDLGDRGHWGGHWVWKTVLAPDGTVFRVRKKGQGYHYRCGAKDC
jgi:hypothetical protein